MPVAYWVTPSKHYPSPRLLSSNQVGTVVFTMTWPLMIAEDYVRIIDWQIKILKIKQIEISYQFLLVSVISVALHTFCPALKIS